MRSLLYRKSLFLFPANVRYDDAQYHGVGEEEEEAGEPEAGDKCRLAEEFELEGLMQPEALGGEPEGSGGPAEGGTGEEGRGGEVEREEDHVPEEVLVFVS